MVFAVVFVLLLLLPVVLTVVLLLPELSVESETLESDEEVSDSAFG